MTDIDPLTPLAFSIYSGRGIYALLLGSGISRSAEIPTGWEVTLDLIRKVAAVEKEDCGPDAASWYRTKFGVEADYSNLLEKVAPTPSERSNTLASYFEATATEREQGKKTPTSAHKAIARLAAKGYFRVIVTTNFDHLTEEALKAEGVNPTVISTADMAHGAMPLTHSPCTVIKVHGDYGDVRIKNISSELSAYPDEMNRLLDRVFDEYGLIVCGWSAAWDSALRDAMFRCSTRRFSTFWGLKGTATKEAGELMTFRQATPIDIESSDVFFSAIEEKVEALEAFNKPHPLSIPIAVASLKKYLSEDRYRIDLRDLVMNEVERVYKNISSLPTNFSTNGDRTYALSQLAKYESSLEMLTALVANGCYYSRSHQNSIWHDCLLRITELSAPTGALENVLKMRRYLACQLLYAGGIAAVASENYDCLRVLLREIRTSTPLSYGGTDTELVRQLVPSQLIESRLLSKDGTNEEGVPVNDRLHRNLREPLRGVIPSDVAYDLCFDRFEYFFTLVWYDIDKGKKGEYDAWAPYGRFIFRRPNYGATTTEISKAISNESAVKMDSWPPIVGGLFVSSATFSKLNDAYIENVHTRQFKLANKYFM
jgi:hypothetical protein